MVDLLDDYGVVQRNGTTIFVKNAIFSTFNQYVGNYKKTNVGYILKHFDGLFEATEDLPDECFIPNKASGSSHQ